MPQRSALLTGPSQVARWEGRVSLTLANPWRTRERAQAALPLSHPQAWLTCPPANRSAPVCCPGEVLCPLSSVLKLVGGRVSSPTTIVAPGPSLSSATGGKGQREGGHFFLIRATTWQMRSGEVSPPALMSPRPTHLNPGQQDQLSVLPR